MREGAACCEGSTCPVRVKTAVKTHKNTRPPRPGASCCRKAAGGVRGAMGVPRPSPPPAPLTSMAALSRRLRQQPQPSEAAAKLRSGAGGESGVWSPRHGGVPDRGLPSRLWSWSHEVTRVGKDLQCCPVLPSTYHQRHPLNRCGRAEVKAARRQRGLKAFSCRCCLVANKKDKVI